MDSKAPLSILPIEWLAGGWVVMTSLAAFGLFGWDKRRSRSAGQPRIRETHLLVIAALGGWPGAWAGMILFRHKTMKASFKAKFMLAFLIWAGLLWACWRARSV